jgi:hypothetical protein
MKAYCHKTYRPEFPEEFNWELLDSHKLRELAVALARDAKTVRSGLLEDRHQLPGIRHALGRIATSAEIAWQLDDEGGAQ